MILWHEFLPCEASIVSKVKFSNFVSWLNIKCKINLATNPQKLFNCILSRHVMSLSYVKLLLTTVRQDYLCNFLTDISNSAHAADHGRVYEEGTKVTHKRRRSFSSGMFNGALMSTPFIHLSLFSHSLRCLYGCFRHAEHISLFFAHTSQHKLNNQ